MAGTAPSRPSWWPAVASSGVAAFTVSAGYGVWSYLVPFGRPVGTGDTPAGTALAVDTLLFAVFAAHHSAMARPRAKARLVRLVPAALERPLYMWVASALLALAFALLTAACVVVAIPWEERTLAEQHGEAYRRDQRQVRWRLVPGLY